MGVGRATLILFPALLLAACAGRPAEFVPITPTPAVTPTPHPRADEADGALRSFAGLIARDDLTFHVDQAIASGGGDGGATIAMDVAGADYAADVAIKGEKALELRQVGGKTYGRSGNGKWYEGDPNELLIDELVNPWLHLCWLDDLRYDGLADEPADAFRFGCDVPYTYQSPVMQVQGTLGTIQAFDLVLDAEGHPVSMHIEGDGPTIATEKGAFTADYEFSRVGEPIEVKRPRT
jgi:hypothetical protein